MRQPIVELRRNEITGFEALMRWHHPLLGMVPPSTFIPLAEQTSLIVGMGPWALKQACQEATTWPEHIKVTVNLSSVQFEQGDLYKDIKDALSFSGLSPIAWSLRLRRACCSVMTQKRTKLLHALRSLDVKIALDDFGTAYASLSYLRSFPFDKIKIDRTFIADLDNPKRKDCIAIIHAVAGLAKQMQMSNVAEGVETLDQLEAVEVGHADVDQHHREASARNVGYGPTTDIRGVSKRPAKLRGSSRKNKFKGTSSAGFRSTARGLSRSRAFRPCRPSARSDTQSSPSLICRWFSLAPSL